jgi:transcriptional regulator with XRE-family HTH domain
MNNVEKQFLAFLAYLSDEQGRGFNRKLSKIANISESYLSMIIKGERTGSESNRRAISNALGYDYDDFLLRGEVLLDGKDPMDEMAILGYNPNRGYGLGTDELRERGFITVPFSDNMKLAAGSGGTVIDVTEDADASTIVVHGPSLRRTSSRNLQAFRVGGDSMEPVIAQNGIVLVDTSDNNPYKIKPGKIYVLCWELTEGECAVKYLSLTENQNYVLISSPDIYLHPPFVKRIEDIQLIGRVIWSWRDHD